MPYNFYDASNDHFQLQYGFHTRLHSMLCWLVVVALMSRTTDWKHTTGYILVRHVFTISQSTSSKRSWEEADVTGCNPINVP